MIVKLKEIFSFELNSILALRRHVAVFLCTSDLYGHIEYGDYLRYFLVSTLNW